MKIVVIGAPLSGKSSLLDELREEGHNVFQPDRFIAESYKKGNEAYKRIAEVFGPEFVNETEVDRNALAEAIMQDKSLITKLNLVIMPLIEEQMNAEGNIFIEANGAVIKDYDKRILVKADKEVLAKRMKMNMPNLNDEFISALIEKWDNNIEVDLVIDTSEGITAAHLREIEKLVND